MRHELIAGVVSLLEGRGFFVSSFIHTNSCFDLIARNGTTMLIKVYSNIDAVRAEQAGELGKLGRVLGVNVLIVGERSKAFSLRDSVVYERYGIPVLTLNSLRGFLGNKLPSVRCFKGRETVELDAEKMREQRKRIGLSLDELAEKLNTSAESIHRYEKGSGASLGTARNLERLLHTSLIRDVEIFRQNEGGKKFDERVEDEVLEKIRRLGIGVAEFQHAPFCAYSRPKEDLLIGRGNAGREVKCSAMHLQKTKRALGSEGMVLAREFRQEVVGGIPVVREEEIDSMSRGSDLMDLIKEKKGKTAAGGERGRKNPG